MVDIAVKQLPKCATHHNPIVLECQVDGEEYRRHLASGGYLSSMCLLHLQENGLLTSPDRKAFLP